MHILEAVKVNSILCHLDLDSELILFDNLLGI